MLVRLAAAIASLCFLSCELVAAQPIARLTTHRALECEIPCKRIAVILIHGITGSKMTWGDPETALYWPKMLATDATLSSEIDIYQIDYDSRRFSGPPAIAIEEALEKQLDQLVLKKQYSKVVFIAHSLGGIFARTYLLHVKLKYGHTALSRFRLVVTLGTPNEGSDLATMAQWLSGNEQLRVLLPVQVNDFQQLVNKSIGEIQAKHVGCASLRSFAAFEMRPVTGIGIIVSEQSATKDAFAKIGFERDHLQLPKPVSLDPIDPVYDWAAGLVRECARNADNVCPVTQNLSCPTGDFPRNPN
jgi:pimeloyl-ACP methyl ester carboxylesterase